MAEQKIQNGMNGQSEIPDEESKELARAQTEQKIKISRQLLGIREEPLEYRIQQRESLRQHITRL